MDKQKMDAQLTIEGMTLIGGQWRAGNGESWQRVSPAYDSVVWQGCWSDEAQAVAAIKAARRVFPIWSELSLENRMNICRIFAENVKANTDKLAKLIAVETGKPLWEAKTEVAAVVGKVANSIEAILKRRWTTTEEISGGMAVTRFRPHGVMFVLGPFNLPAHLPGAHIVPALLAGNTVVFKPSELAPASGQMLAQLWQDSGLPAGVLNLVHGAADIATTIVQHEDIDGVLFTGSHQVGNKLHRMLAGQPHKVLALEMGGNNPLVVHEASDVRGAALTTIMSAFITSGQRCTCARRLIAVGLDVGTQLIEQLSQLLPKIAVGLPLDDPQPFMGTLINRESADRMLAAQQQYGAQGHELVVPMRQLGQCPALLTPGLLRIHNTETRMEDCEHFGPLLTVSTVESLDQAIESANRTRYGLSAGFIGDRVEDFHYFLHRVRAGVVNWNRQTTGASGKLPFGGIGYSGNHRPSGYFAADYCSYPVASLESHDLGESAVAVPGLELL